MVSLEDPEPLFSSELDERVPPASSCITAILLEGLLGRLRFTMVTAFLRDFWTYKNQLVKY